MPNFNGTGPLGQGPRTGRGAGKCGGNNPDIPADRGVGRGLGRRVDAGFRFQNEK